MFDSSPDFGLVGILVVVVPVVEARERSHIQPSPHRHPHPAEVNWETQLPSACSQYLVDPDRSILLIKIIKGVKTKNCIPVPG